MIPHVRSAELSISSLLFVEGERDKDPRGNIGEDERTGEEQREEEEPHDNRVNVEVFGEAARHPGDNLILA